MPAKRTPQGAVAPETLTRPAIITDRPPERADRCIITPPLCLPTEIFGGDYSKVGFVWNIGRVKYGDVRELFAGEMAWESEIVAALQGLTRPEDQAKRQELIDRQDALGLQVKRWLVCYCLYRIEWPFADEPAPDLSDPATLDRLEAPQMLEIGRRPVLDFLSSPLCRAGVVAWWDEWGRLRSYDAYGKRPGAQPIPLLVATEATP